MAKVIAVYGSPGSGKTTVAFKLAQEVYCMTSDSTVILLSPDTQVPSLALLFPNFRDSDLYSLGEILDSTDIFEEDILRRLVTVKTMKSFGCLGFKAGENKYSYPRPTPDKVTALFKALSDIAGYVFVDCTNSEDNPISRAAAGLADTVIQTITPDLKSLAFFSSNVDMLESIDDRLIKVMNITENELYIPTEDAGSRIKGIETVLPYSRAVKQQLLDGKLSDRTKDRKYQKAMKALAGKII